MEKKKNIASWISIVICLVSYSIPAIFALASFAVLKESMGFIGALLAVIIGGFTLFYITYIILKYIIYFIIK